MLFQVHWQNRSNLSETMMVSQNEFIEGQHEEKQEWIRDVIERHKADCPDGWIPFVCDESCDEFWWKFGDKIGPRPAPDQGVNDAI